MVYDHKNYDLGFVCCSRAVNGHLYASVKKGGHGHTHISVCDSGHISTSADMWHRGSHTHNLSAPRDQNGTTRYRIGTTLYE